MYIRHAQHTQRITAARPPCMGGRPLAALPLPLASCEEASAALLGGMSTGK